MTINTITNMDNNKKGIKESSTIEDARKNTPKTDTTKKDIAGLLDFVRKVYALKK
jgi:hypothetical protein